MNDESSKNLNRMKELSDHFDKGTMGNDRLENLNRIEELSNSLDDIFTVANCFLEETPFLYIAVSRDQYIIRYLFGDWKKHFGFNRHELIGKNFLTLLHPDDINNTLSELSQKEEKGNKTGVLVDCPLELNDFCARRETIFKNRIRTKEGNFKELLWQSQPLEEINSLVLGIVVPGVDTS